MISDKIRKIMIVQLCAIEVFLLMILIREDSNSCALENDNKNLLVYNYNSTVLSPRVVKNEKVEVNFTRLDEEVSVKEEEEIVEEEIEEEVEEETVEEVEEVVEEVYSAPTVYYAPPVVNDVNYTVAENLVEYAKQFVGYPYVYGGNSLTNGTDCSGFTKLIYAEYGINLPRVAYDQSFVGVEVSVSQIQIGDLVLSGYEGKTHHVAIYIGNGQIVHALNPNAGIVITDLYIMPITHVRRVL